jgi:hypothetical protein
MLYSPQGFSGECMAEILQKLEITTHLQLMSATINPVSFAASSTSATFTMAESPGRMTRFVLHGAGSKDTPDAPAGGAGVGLR